eukprot:356115-Chlamydomonas_euryale.AAC.3
MPNANKAVAARSQLRRRRRCGAGAGAAGRRAQRRGAGRMEGVGCCTGGGLCVGRVMSLHSCCVRGGGIVCGLRAVVVAGTAPAAWNGVQAARLWGLRAPTRRCCRCCMHGGELVSGRSLLPYTYCGLGG